MMQFDRIASIEIGPPGGAGLRVDKSRIVFQVDKTDKVESNKCRVEILNLSDATRARIRETDDAITIKAGYAEDGGEEVVFMGRVVRLEHRYPAPDIVTRIEGGDGISELRESRTSASFAGNAKMQDIVDKLIDDFGLELRDSIDVPRVRWTQGWSYSGPTREALRRVLEREGLEYSIQNGYLQIIERGGVNKKAAVLISSATGLLSSPARLNELAGDTEGSKKKPGWAFRCLLNPKIEPGGTVQLQSRDVRGFFRVNNVRHDGDTHGDEWSSQVEVSEIVQPN